MGYSSSWLSTTVLSGEITNLFIGKSKSSGRKTVIRNHVQGSAIDTNFQGSKHIQSDEQWIEEQFNSVPSPDRGYTDVQFNVDLHRASHPLEERAERARRSLAQGTSKKFPQ